MEKTVSKLYDLSLFIFRRDLRLEDNKALINCLKQSKIVLLSFILDNKQLNQEKNEYFSHNLVQFMCESLIELNESLTQHGSRLHFFNGEMEDIINLICKEIKPSAIFFNEDITPYALKRDQLITDISQRYGIKTLSYQDMMLLPKEKVMQPNGKFYQKWTPYYKHAVTFDVDKPIKNTFSNYISSQITYPFEYPIKDLGKFYKFNPNIEVHGGRQYALKILESIKQFKNYTETRDYPTLPTTKLSAYNKFGCASIREVYHTMKKEIGKTTDQLIQQLYWRDFFYGVVFYYPHVIGQALRKEFNDIPWGNNAEWFNRWKEGTTGCPIVDAGMRHLNTTGYLPNRIRLVVASFLVKDLLIDWKWGEKYFASKLVDYDPSQNNGGWQWTAGTDSQPDYRVFNPKIQMEKFDSECEYMLKWIPELKSVPKKSIINWEGDHLTYVKMNIGYPAPIIKHFDQKDKYIEMIQKYNVKRGNHESEEVKMIKPVKDNNNKGYKSNNKPKAFESYKDYITKF